MKKIIGFVASRIDVDFSFPFRDHFKWLQFEKHQIGSWVVYLWGFGDFDTFIKRGKETQIIVGYSEHELNILGTDRMRNRGIIIRIEEDRLSIENDIIGAFQVFYGSVDGNACVSSVEELVLQAIGNREVDQTNLVQYLLVGHLTCNHTLYRKVNSLEANSCLNWVADRFKVSSLPPIRFEEIQNPVRTLYESTRTTIKKYVKPYDKMFLPLSGGYDSRLLAANLSEPQCVIARTYGYSYPLESSYEVMRANAVAKASGIKNWELFDLGQDYIADYARQWFDIFGTTHHLHGMYQLCFYSGILGTGPSLVPTISGYVGDAIVGHQLHEFSDVSEANSKAKFFKAQYSGPLGFTTDELKTLLPWDIEESLSVIDNRWKAKWDNTEGADYQKFILTLLRERGRTHVSYLCTIADLYGGVITPFIDRDYMATALSLPADALRHRSAQEEIFRKFYPHVWFDDGQFPPYEHYLNYLAIKKRKLENLFPMVKDGKRISHELFNDTFIKTIIEDYMRLCEQDKIVSHQWPIRSLHMCYMLLPLFFVQDQRLKDVNQHKNQSAISEIHLIDKDHIRDKKYPVHPYADKHVNYLRTEHLLTEKSNRNKTRSVTSETKSSSKDSSTKSEFSNYDAEYFNWQKKIGAFGGIANLFKFKNHIKPEDIVLDFGCGGGYLLNQINCKEKIGVEINKYARRNCSKFNIQAFPDLTKIRENYIDVAISNHALEHLENPLGMLKQLRKKLKENGKAIFVVPHQDINEEYEDDDKNNHLFTWNKQTIGNLFVKAGFKIKSIDLIQHQWPKNYEQLYKEKGEVEFHKICHEYAQKNNNFQIIIVAKTPLKNPKIVPIPQSKEKASETPVVLITYNRPWHTEQVLQALRQHERKSLYIFSDGAKKNEDIPKVRETRKLIHKIDWCEPIIIERKENFGLAKSIIGAVNSVFEQHDSLILLEDDCLPQKYFFEFVEECLEKYKSVENLFGISGYTVSIPEYILQHYPYDLYFFPRIGSWGWATWKNRWKHFESDLDSALQKALLENIDLEQGGNDVTKMLKQLKEGKLKDVWTLNWLISVYLRKGYYIYPTQSHISNIGMDGKGVHCGRTHKFESHIAECKPHRYPENIINNDLIYENFRKYYDIPRNYNVPKKNSDDPTPNAKVVNISTHDFGGAGKAAYHLHTGLQKIGVETTMLVMNKKYEDPSVKVFPEKFSPNYVTCDDSKNNYSTLYAKQKARWNDLLENYSNRPKGLEFFTDTQSDIRLDHLKEFKDADIINLHWVAGTLDYLAAPISFHGKKTVWTLHDMNPFTGGCHYSANCEKYKMQCGACPQLGSTDENDLSREIWHQKFYAYQNLNLHIVTPSRWLANCVAESSLLSKFPVTVIPNGIPLDKYQPYRKSEIRQALNISESANVILFGAVNVDNQRKGFKYLLAAMEKVSPDPGREIILLTFGQMSENNQIKSKFPIGCLGEIADEYQLALAYSAADVFVIPSLEDNLPNTVLEAMACGVPVVGFDIGGMPDVIEHKQNGFLANFKDIPDLVNGIEWALSTKMTSNDISALCRKKVEKQFAQEIQAEAYKKLYDSIISSPSVKSNSVVSSPNDMTANSNQDQKTVVQIYEKAHQLIEKQRIGEAIETLEKLIEMEPGFAIAYNDLGVLCSNTGENKKALQFYEKAIQFEPENITFKKNLADFNYAIRGEIEEALKMYLEILQSDSKDIEVLLRLGKACSDLQKFEDANVFFQRVLEMDPENKSAIFGCQSIEQLFNTQPQQT